MSSNGPSATAAPEGHVRPLAFAGSKPFPASPDVALMKPYLPD